MLVRDYMSTQIVTVAPEASILDALHLFTLHRVHHLCVVEHRELRGVISDRDVLLAMPRPDSQNRNLVARQMLVTDVMTRDPLVARPEMPIETAAETLWRHTVNCLPVMIDLELIGVLTTRDCLRALVSIMPRLRQPH